MSKFKITVSGYGCDAIIFPITDEQMSTFQDGEVVDGGMDSEEICEVLEVDDYYSADNMVNGLYFNNEGLSKSINIVVENEIGDEIWRTDDSFKFDYETVETDYLFNEEPYFLVEAIEKGVFRVYEIEADSFNPELLTPVVVELLDGVLELMTTLSYDGVVLDGEFGDTRGTGDNYYLYEY